MLTSANIMSDEVCVSDKLEIQRLEELAADRLEQVFIRDKVIEDLEKDLALQRMRAVRAELMVAAYQKHSRNL